METIYISFTSPSCSAWARWRSLCCPYIEAQRTTSPSARLSSLSKYMKEHNQSHAFASQMMSLTVLARHTWSKSCFPVVLGRMANSSSASMVVTRTFICQRKTLSLRYRGKCSLLCIHLRHWRSIKEHGEQLGGKKEHYKICTNIVR